MNPANATAKLINPSVLNLPAMVRPDDVSRLPKSLQELDRWILWRWEFDSKRGGKPTKVPYRTNGRDRASSIREADWVGLEEAAVAMRSSQNLGLGFVFAQGDGLVGIDLDNCLKADLSVKPWAQPIVERFADCYIETSPRGKGLKIFARASISHLVRGTGGRRSLGDGEVEVYHAGRYFTVTGDSFAGSPSEVEHKQQEIEWLIKAIALSANEGASKDLRSVAKSQPTALPDQLAAFAEIHPSFKRLWGGDNSSYGGDASKADLAFCSLLAQNLNLPAASIDAAFRTSARMRGKWDERHASDGSTYGELTLKKALYKKTTIPDRRDSGAPASPESSDWTEALMRTRTGEARPILANALAALVGSPDWSGVLGFDEFAQRVVARKAPPWSRGKPGQWGDQEDRLAAEWLQRNGILVSVEVAGQATQTAARHAPFHPLRDYLQSLEWDGTARIDRWLIDYLGAEQTDFNKAVGIRWLISAVARVFNPGTKVDSCLILEGPQGMKKSTALRVLGGQYFTDEISELGSKDAAMQVQGAWIIELSELAAIGRKAELDRVKAFMSRSYDRFRPPYGAHVIEAPRQCIFAGTVNSSEYLRDETGGRRFWPVACSHIDTEALGRDRDQLWAEAVVRFRDGEVWWLETLELNRAASEEQEARYEDDPWEPRIAGWLDEPHFSGLEGDESIECEPLNSFSTGEILQHAISKPIFTHTQIDRNRVAKIFRRLGWVRKKVRIGDRFEWRYRKADR